MPQKMINWPFPSKPHVGHAQYFFGIHSVRLLFRFVAFSFFSLISSPVNDFESIKMKRVKIWHVTTRSGRLFYYKV